MMATLRKLLALVALGVVGVISTGARADAGRVFVMPFVGAGDEPLAVTLLLASSLNKQTRDVVPFGDMLRAVAIDRALATGKPTGLCKALSADRAASGDIRITEHQLELALHGVDCNGVDVYLVRLQYPRGELQALGAAAAKALAPNLGLAIKLDDRVQMGAMRASARALHGVLIGDLPAAASAFRLNDPALAKRLIAVRELGRFIANQTELTPRQRAEVALAAADPDLTLAIIKAQKPPLSTELTAAMARAYVQKGELTNAAKTLAPFANSTDSNFALALARMELAFAEADKDTRDKLIKEAKNALVGSSPDSAIAAFLARVSPSGLSPEADAALIAAAQHLSNKDAPGVASAVGERAAAANDAAGAALMSPDDYDAREMASITDGLEGSGGTVGDAERLQQNLANAKNPGAVAKQLAAQIGARGKGTSTAKPEAEQLPPIIESNLPSVLQAQFGVMLGNFPALGQARGGTIVVAEHVAKSAPFYFPTAVVLPIVHRAFVSAVTQEPFRMAPTSELVFPLRAPSNEELEKLAVAQEARFILLYAATPKTDGAQIKLTLYDRTTQTTTDFNEHIHGEQIRKWNPLYGLPFVMLLIVGVAWLSKQRAGGAIEIVMDGGPYGDRQILCIQLTPSAKPPLVLGDEPEEALATLPPDPLRKMNASRVTEFTRVAKGEWHIHAFGIHLIDGKPIVMAGELYGQATLMVGKKEKVTLTLRSPYPQVRVEVVDGSKPVQARILVDGDASRSVATDASGAATIDLAFGNHTVTVQFSDNTEIKRTVHAMPGRPIDPIKINLKHEARMAPIAVKVEEKHDEFSAASFAAVEKAAAPKVDENAGMLGYLDEGSDFSSFAAAPAAAPVPAPAPEKSAAAPPAPVIAEPSVGVEIALASDDVDHGSDHASAAPPTKPAPPAPAKSAAGGGNSTRYRRAAEVARNVAGVIYRGQDTVENRAVALIVPSDDLRNSKPALAGYLADMQRLRGIDHPSLLAVYDEFVDGADQVVVTELASPRTLAMVLGENGRQSVPQALALGTEIASALALLHAQGVFHRALGPDNISVGEDGLAKLVNFGVGRAARVTKNKAALSPLYLSPEQIRGDEGDALTDLYAFGCTVYALLTGAPPFATGDVIAQHLNAEPIAPTTKRAEIPKALSDVVLACLAKEPYERPKSAAAIEKSLRAVRVKR